jgi:hypothetical protein
MRKENDHVPPPWGNDMEEALMAQGEAIRKKTISVPRRRWLSWCRSTTLRGLGLIIAIVLAWFLLAFAMAIARGSARAIRNDSDRSFRQGITPATRRALTRQ